MPNLVCRKCKYQFNKDKVPLRCPYCSNSNAVEIAKSSQDLLDEVSSEMEEIEQRRKERGY